MNIIHENAAIVVVDTPHGQHVQPTPQGAEGTLLAMAQAQYGPSIRLVHRLDRDASGLLVLARDRKTAGILGEALRTHAIERVYHAVVSIQLPDGLEATIDAPLRWAGGRTWVDEHGTPAVTHYAVEGSHAQGTALSLQRASPHAKGTPRTSPIGITMASAMGIRNHRLIPRVEDVRSSNTRCHPRRRTHNNTGIIRMSRTRVDARLPIPEAINRPASVTVSDRIGWPRYRVSF